MFAALREELGEVVLRIYSTTTLAALLVSAVAGCTSGPSVSSLMGRDSEKSREIIIEESVIGSKQASTGVSAQEIGLAVEPSSSGLSTDDVGGNPRFSTIKLSSAGKLSAVAGNASEKEEKKRSSVAQALKKARDAVSDTFVVENDLAKRKEAKKLARNPGQPNAAALIQAARAAETQGQIGLAIENYRKAIDLEPTNVKALISFARIHDRTERFHDAIIFYSRVIEIEPQNAVALNDLGLCYARQGRLEQSIQSLGRAIVLQEDSKLYRNNIATVLVESGRIEEALEHLTKAHPAAVAHYNLGYLLYQQRDRALAIEHFSRAATLDPALKPAQQMLKRMQAYQASRRPLSNQRLARPDRPPAQAPQGKTRYSIGDSSPKNVSKSQAEQRPSGAVYQRRPTSRYAASQDQKAALDIDWGSAPAPEAAESRYTETLLTKASRQENTTVRLPLIVDDREPDDQDAPAAPMPESLDEEDLRQAPLQLLPPLDD